MRQSFYDPEILDIGDKQETKNSQRCWTVFKTQKKKYDVEKPISMK